MKKEGNSVRHVMTPCLFQRVTLVEIQILCGFGFVRVCVRESEREKERNSECAKE